MLKEDTKKLYRNLGTNNIEIRELYHYCRSRALMEVIVGRKSTAK